MKLNRKTLKQMVLEEYNEMMKKGSLEGDSDPVDQELVDDDPVVALKSQLIQTIKRDYVDKIRDSSGIQMSEASVMMVLLDAVLDVVNLTNVSNSEADMMVAKIRDIAGAQKEM